MVRLLVLIFLVVLLIFFWDSPLMLPAKLLVVYFHEISHAIAALLTGGKVQGIAVAWNESGYVNASGGIFFIVAMAGYIGSIIWGSVLLYSALKYRFMRVVSFLTGVVLIFFSLLPGAWSVEAHENISRLMIGIGWGSVFMAASIFNPYANHVLLFIAGGMTTLYSLYDLDDFFSGRIMQTDAGILARYYFGDSPIAFPFAWMIAVLISSVALWIFITMTRHSLSEHKDETEEEDMPDEKELEWLEKYSRQKKGRWE